VWPAVAAPEQKKERKEQHQQDGDQQCGQAGDRSHVGAEAAC
jgi:hypothetical protein